MNLPKTCTNVVKGVVCGEPSENFMEGVCFKCGTDYNNAPPVGDDQLAAAAAAAKPADADEPHKSSSRSGNRSRTGSRAGGSRIGSTQVLSTLFGINGAKRKTREGSSSSQRIRSAVGRGYVVIPEIPSSNPRTLIKDKYLKAARDARTCCGTKERPHDPFVLINQQADGTIRQKGVCPARCADGQACKKPFNFTGDDVPPLPILPDTVIANQFKVLGTIAQGGCGFIDILLDLDLSGTTGPEKKVIEQFAIAKTQITKTKRDQDVSIAEKAMLANLRDTSIASVLGFKEHNGMPVIVMEWIDGKTVAEIWKGRGGSLTVAESLAYGLEMCVSMSFLHSHGVINPDLKPDNYMQYRDRLKQIDAGGWLLETDLESNVTSTEGYAPREVDDPKVPCSPTRFSDIYSLGRMMWVLAHYKRPDKQATAEWEVGRYRYTLPETSESFEMYPSYEALIRRCCHEKPEGRFATVDELAEQIEGVLREVVAIDAIRAGKPQYRLWQSQNFSGDTSGGSEDLSIKMLPTLRLDMSDRAAGEIDTILASSSDATIMLAMLHDAVDKYPKSDEAKLRLINHLIDSGEFNEAEQRLSAFVQEDSFDWRNSWYMGKLLLAKKEYKSAMEYFDIVVSYLPGEPAAKLAAGIAAELAGELGKAINIYDLVTKVEPGYSTAAFGQARCLMKEGNRDSAVEVLCRVPPTSIARTQAQIAAAVAQVQSQPTKPGQAELTAAAGFLFSVVEETYRWHRAAADFFVAAGESGVKDSKTKVLGVPLAPRKLFAAAERELLLAARMAESEGVVADLQELALKVRPTELLQL